MKTTALIATLFVALIAVVFLFNLSKRDEASPSDLNSLPLAQDDNGNFVLYVSNQSFAIDPVDITVKIDGRIAVNEDFSVENQHNWIAFQFSIPKGKHTLSVESTKGSANLETEFEMTSKHWAVLNYWYYPDVKEEVGVPQKHFTFELHDEPVYFN